MADFAEIQAKYAAEAQKRLRPDGSAQYEVLEASKNERLRHLVDDVWADHAALDALPAPLAAGDSTKFLIAGAGIGGLVAAVRLIQAGFSVDQIRFVETAGGLGGTWYWNRYPGLHCDVESYTYLPLLEETGFVPSHKYSSGLEIRKYLELLAKKWNLDDKILYRTKLDKLEWDDAARAWKANITTGRGPKGADKTSFSVTVEYVWLTAGLLSRPHVPKLGGAGIEGFGGDIFHTSLWNYNVTGGSSEEADPVLSKLKDKRVGIIGTGATAIQVVPRLAEYAKELYVFQRTPSAVYGRGQRPTDPEEFRTKIAGHKGWHDERLQNMALNISNDAPPGIPDLVDDEWTHNPAYSALVADSAFADAGPERVPEIIAHYLARDAESSARLRARISDIVKDPETARKLTPWYPVWCKRPTFSDTYLQAFNRPNVHLVDTDGRGVAGATASGLVAGGAAEEEVPLDVLVLGTGYKAPTGDPSTRAGVAVLGRGGVSLAAKWAARGASTLHGYASHGFPNLFWLSPLQSGVSANHAYPLDLQSRQAAYVLATAFERAGVAPTAQAGGPVVEVDEAAEEAWSMRIVGGAARFATLSVCTPSYINDEGHFSSPNDPPEELLRSARSSPFSGGVMGYVDVLRKWREEGKLSGITVTAP
ncbi:FAD/NAD(P)-binding domain-containing protein [Durotheca rogersii]|uniref:FAD/NAD(P)-binding domain-containing protein n=1 Tax=Durotheca rogersii TaxID=419775 RepID=UPI002220E81E|nr:FAD/NAD(P)-binding domain-containing protein [Durotheca rogersii]KAI5861697.1 FAD/NAD(P)-binding domain-containing protein [Durotheca rogersii]